MMRAGLSLLPLLSLASIASASVVVELNADTFGNAVKSNPLMLVKFYAPWCGHCKQLEPEYEKAAVAMHGKVTLAKVDATVEVSLAEQYRVDGYPTLYFFRNGAAEEYGGGRQNSSIVDWVNEHAGPSLVVVTSEDELQKELKARKVLPYFVAKGGADARRIFEQLADENRGLGIFVFMEREGDPVVQVHRGFDEIIERAGADSVADASSVLSFLEENMIPPFSEISEDNYAGYLARATQGMVWLCFAPDTFREDALRHAGVFKEVADTFKQFPVVFTDTKVYHEHVKEELGCRDLPALALQLGNFTNEEEDPRRFVLQLNLEALSAPTISDWIRSALAGEVQEDDGLDELDASDEEEDEDEATEEGADIIEEGGEVVAGDGGADDVSAASATGGQEL